MKLPPGATGFGPAPRGGSGDIQAVIAACYHAARQTGGSVSETATPGVTPNFYTITVEYPGHAVAVLKHRLLPLLAIAEPRPAGDSGPITFIDQPDLATAIADTSGLEVLAQEQLGTPVSRADLTGLDPDEHQQINYWKPATVGELLFNFWD
jgi:hypothetical protein